MASHLLGSLVYFVVLLFHQENHILKPFNALLTNFEMENLSLLHVKATFDDIMIVKLFVYKMAQLHKDFAILFPQITLTSTFRKVLGLAP